MGTKEITRMTLHQDLFNQLEKLDKKNGVQRARVNQLRETFGHGILNGNVVFTPPNIDGQNYNNGILQGQIEDKDSGEIVSIEREITDPQEILILASFQHEAKAKRKQTPSY